MVERLLIGLLTGGHVLLEGVPGLAKTLTVQTLAETIAHDVQRIQFTPDLLPADVTRHADLRSVTPASSRVKQGPIFANIVLADEINRAPAKVQAALLEAMQEKQVTIGGTTFVLDEPFLVLATQNPIEQEGTYPLPEAQVDRFMLKLHVGYPTRDEEKEIMRRMAGGAGDRRSSTSRRQQAIWQRASASPSSILDDAHRRLHRRLVHATRAPADANLKRSRAADRVRRQPARDDLPRAGRARARVPARARLRHARTT